MQVHNVKDINEIKNEGMTSWTHEGLKQKVETELKKYPDKTLETLPNPINVMETRNFVGKFVSELDMRSFPFDQQTLRIVRGFSRYPFTSIN